WTGTLFRKIISIIHLIIVFTEPWEWWVWRLARRWYRVSQKTSRIILPISLPKKRALKCTRGQREIYYIVYQRTFRQPHRDGICYRLFVKSKLHGNVGIFWGHPRYHVCEPGFKQADQGDSKKYSITNYCPRWLHNRVIKKY